MENEKKEKIDYLAILKKSLKVTFGHKYLWLFGFLIALTSNSGSMNYSVDEGSGQGGMENIVGYLSSHPGLIAVISFSFLIIILTFIAVNILGKTGLIISLDKIAKSKKSGFILNFKEAKKFFFRVLGLRLLIFVFMLLIIITLAFPIIFLFSGGKNFLAIILASWAIVIFIPISITLSYIVKYAEFYIILSGLTIRSAMERGYYLFKENIISSIIMFLVFIPIILVLLFAFLLVLISIFITFGLIAFGLYFILGTAGAAIIAIIGILFFISIAIAIRSIYEAFYQTSWFFFFHKIAGDKIDDSKKEEVEMRKIATIENM